MNSAITGTALLTATLLAGGCATVSQEDLDALRNEVSAVERTAELARNEAQSANAVAEAASRDAAAALAAARQAQQIATDARTASQATDDRVDRMFRRAMMK